MCGRTACTLNADDISKSCRYGGAKGKNKNPKWIGGTDKYQPSYNKAPQSYCPILLNASHFKGPRNEELSIGEEDKLVLSPMRWGLIPSWFKGENVDKVNYSMNNARSDTVMEKRSYSIPLRKGQRCVVLCEGFYEWNTTKAGKQPYYIYFPSSDDKNQILTSDNVDAENVSPKIKVETKAETLSPNSSEITAKKPTPSQQDNKKQVKYNSDSPKRLVTMAGIFEKTFHKGEDLYSFTIITVDADPSFSWLHHRMPAMLTNEEEVNAWLDYENVPLNKALQLIKPKDCLQWHPVSKYVNNSRNHGPECREEIDLTEIKKSGSDPKFKKESKSMMKWLTSGGSPNKFSQSGADKKRPRGGAMDKFVSKKPKTGN